MNTLHEVYGSSPASTVNQGGAARPRLLYLITRAERGGAQVHVMDLAMGMRDQFEVEVATGEEGYLTEACRRHGIPVHVLPHLEREVRPWRDLRAFQELKQLIRRIKPDLVHSHTFKSGFLGRLAAKQLSIPSVYTVHMWPFGPAVPLSWRLVAPACERLAAGWCNRLITVSRRGAAEAAEFRICKPSHVVPIWNGIEDSPLRAHLGHEGEVTCTMVARFAAPKDHLLLLRAFAQVAGQPRLRLVGDGPEIPKAKKLAQELGIAGRVDFMGSRGDVPELLTQTDVFVLASRLETLPLSILEAMRAGLPVIASGVGGVSEEVIHGETGLIVRSGSVDEMSAALTRLLADKALRIAMGRAGRRRFEDRFLANTMLERTESVYRTILTESLAER